MPTSVTVTNGDRGTTKKYQVTYTAGNNDCTSNKGYSKTVVVQAPINQDGELVIPVTEDSVKSLSVSVLA